MMSMPGSLRGCTALLFTSLATLTLAASVRAADMSEPSRLQTPTFVAQKDWSLTVTPYLWAASSVTEALEMWTIWAAKPMGEDAFKGSIEPGKYADMAVLSDDVLTMPTTGLKDVKVLKTVLGGRTVYEAR
ncbi:amidohydrolase family protein [Bosea sp. CS1GBMeth4]|uniref:amidohydrolase family protein n=1 Tax=Bosea sp. CS1GBMeth4 TaxID=1892849 RepID=UPI0016443B7E|nr:amidohydrolase family protein [Bosea sp. CS1GBMeth4]